MENEALNKHLKQTERRLLFIYGVGLLILVMLSICSNFLLREQAAKQATSLIRRTIERGDFRETAYTLNDAKLDYFDAVVYFDQHDRRLFSIPAQLDPEFIGRSDWLSELLYTRLNIDLFFGEPNGHKIGSVLFVFGRFSHVPYAIGIWLLFLVGIFPLLRIARKRIIQDQTKEIFYREESSKADLARRVRHDIRSPFGALQIATRDLSDLNPKQRAIIQRATDRISEIISELELIRTPSAISTESASASAPAQSVLSIAQEIIQEKRLQFLERTDVEIVPEFSEEAFFLFAKFKTSELRRTLSNLIDNAVEAYEGDKARVVVALRKDGEAVKISITDQGRGIATDDLARVFEKGFTKKKTGSGLGLYYANKCATEAGGSLEIASVLGEGTVVTISMPLAEPPSWYVPKVAIPNGATVVILDDQESTHLAWKMRLDELREAGATFTVKAFKNAQDLMRWHSRKSRGNAIYLLDYDLGKNEPTGLDIAQSLKLSSTAILVTGHFDSEEIQSRCAEEKIGLLPKPYLSRIEFISQ